MTSSKAIKLLGLTILVLTLVSAPISAAAPPPSEQGAAPFVQGELLLKVKPGVSPSEVARSVGGTVLRSLGDGSIQLLKVRDGAVSAAVQALHGRPGVVFAEPNWLRQLHDAPNDPGYGLKWDLNNTGTLCDGSDCADADADMDWQEAYTSLGSNFNGSAIVAVIDTGIDLNHPDLDGKLVNGYDYLDGDSNPADTYGHGTHVAGIVLAETNNGAGTAGVGYSPNIKVMPLRVCDEGGCPTDAIVSAIYHAADSGANVINLSLGGRFGSTAEQIAIDYAWGKGLVIAASSGNDGARKVSYPAAFTNCIAVGSTNWHDALAKYSNKGTALDVVAPGGEMSSLHDPGGIYSTMPTYSVYLNSAYGYSQNYDQLQGTSMAAPQVAGLAGLLFAAGAGTNAEVRDIIETTVDDLGTAGWDLSFGWGRVNVNNAVQAAVGGGGGSGGTMYVSDIAMSFKTAGPNLSGIAIVTIVDDNSQALDGVTVSGTWSGAYSGSASAVTGTDGTARFESGKVKASGITFTFTVDDVAKTGYTYNPVRNVETSDFVTVP